MSATSTATFTSTRFDPGATFLRVTSCDVSTLDVQGVRAVLGDIAALHRALQGREVDANARLRHLAQQTPGLDPDSANAEATGRSTAAASKATKRARSAEQAPAIKERMDDGQVSGEHLDAFAGAVAALPAHLRPQLLAIQAGLAADAVGTTVEQFRERLRREAHRIEGDDGVSRLERQKRDTSLRTWTNNESGMWHISGRFDPETAASLQQRLLDQLEARFHADRPAECPTDALLAQDWLRAHALADLVRCGGGVRGGGTAKPEMIIVIDQKTLEEGRHAHSRVDCGAGLELPIESIRAIAGRARFVPVVISADGVVIRQGAAVASYAQLVESLRRPVPLDAGRTRRHATRHQRRALRAMYRSCAIPGCERHVSLTEPHHVQFWEHGGPTDLHLLLPVCRHHHDRLHAERWQVRLAPDRSLVVRRDGELIMSTGPPATQWALPRGRDLVGVTSWA